MEGDVDKSFPTPRDVVERLGIKGVPASSKQDKEPPEVELPPGPVLLGRRGEKITLPQDEK